MQPSKLPKLHMRIHVGAIASVCELYCGYIGAGMCGFGHVRACAGMWGAMERVRGHYCGRAPALLRGGVVGLVAGACGHYYGRRYGHM